MNEWMNEWIMLNWLIQDSFCRGWTCNLIIILMKQRVLVCPTDIITRQFQLDTGGICGACTACFTPPSTLEPHVKRVDALAGQYLSVVGGYVEKRRSVWRVVELIVAECQSLHGVTQTLHLATTQRVVVAVTVNHQLAILEVVDVLDVDLRRWHDALQSTVHGFTHVHTSVSLLGPLHSDA